MVKVLNFVLKKVKGASPNYVYAISLLAISFFIKKTKRLGVVLKPVILTTQEEEIGRIMV
jgi:hypothetical protein